MTIEDKPEEKKPKQPKLWVISSHPARYVLMRQAAGSAAASPENDPDERRAAGKVVDALEMRVNPEQTWPERFCIRPELLPAQRAATLAELQGTDREVVSDPDAREDLELSQKGLEFLKRAMKAFGSQVNAISQKTYDAALIDIEDAKQKD